jgi:hypothetical protein
VQFIASQMTVANDSYREMYAHFFTNAPFSLFAVQAEDARRPDVNLAGHTASGGILLHQRAHIDHRNTMAVSSQCHQLCAVPQATTGAV